MISRALFLWFTVLLAFLFSAGTSRITPSMQVKNPDFCFTTNPRYSPTTNIILPNFFEKAAITVPESVHAHGPITVHFKLTNQHTTPLTICKRNTPLDSVENKIYHINASEARLVPSFLGFGRAKVGMRM
jgi:hypothetical protein